MPSQKKKRMALIKSISGIRGTIGGKTNDNLTPLDVVKFAAAYGTWLMQQSDNYTVIIGRDGRISGEMVSSLVVNTLLGLGLNVVDLGLSTTPTVEMAVQFENAAGGIILTASHNPKEWNALKLLNSKGEFISGDEGKLILDLAAAEDFNFATVDKLGTYTKDVSALQKHIDAVVNYPLVDIAAIKKAKFNIVVDAVNSTGAFAVPELLKALGVKDITVINEEVNGKFAHNPEPLPENLTGLSAEVIKQKASLGIAIDPDVDRLCFVCEDGSMFGEEYTLVAVSDYVLSKRKGNTVSNMSSTRALKDVTVKNGGEYFPSAVGEVNVVNKMKQESAVIGGEGNGGIIVPDLHYGRDALIGIALFLTHLAKTKLSASALRGSYPAYFMSKMKIDLEAGTSLSKIFSTLEDKFKNYSINKEDGLKIDFDQEWVHLRSSNTEPIIRVYTESTSQASADKLAQEIISIIETIK